MKLAISWPGAASGAAAGMLLGLLLQALGLGLITAHDSAPLFAALGLVLGGLVGLVGFGRWIMLAAAGFFALVYAVVAFTPLMTSVATGWVRSDRVPPSVDGIVVLSSDVLSDTAVSTEAADRLLAGLELFQRGLSTRLFTTHVEVAFSDGVRSSTPDQTRLIRLGGATQAWTMLEAGLNTHDEALEVAVKLPPGATSIAVVTSPMHTRRACGAFEAVGFHVTCVPALMRWRATAHPITARDRVQAFAEYAYERLGIVKYRWKNWLPAGQ